MYFLSLNAIGQYTKGLCHLVDTLNTTNFIYQNYNTDKADICIRDQF